MLPGVTVPTTLTSARLVLLSSNVTLSRLKNACGFNDPSFQLFGPLSFHSLVEVPNQVNANGLVPVTDNCTVPGVPEVGRIVYVVRDPLFCTWKFVSLPTSAP